MNIHLTGLPAILAVVLAIGGLADVLTILTRPLADRYAIRPSWIVLRQPAGVGIMNRFSYVPLPRSLRAKYGYNHGWWLGIPYLRIVPQWARPGGYVKLSDGQPGRLVTILKNDECQAPDIASAYLIGADGYGIDDGEPAKWYELDDLEPAGIPDARRLSRIFRRRVAA